MNYHNLITFIPESGIGSSSPTKGKKTTKTSHEEGKEVKAFYEKLISDTSGITSSSQDTVVQSQTKCLKPENDDKVNYKQFKQILGSYDAKRKKVNEVKSPDSVKNKKLHSECGLHDEVVPSQKFNTFSVANNRGESAGILDSDFFNGSFPSSSQRDHFKLLQYAQLGDVKKLKELLNKDLDVNFKDFYGWTALMCAAKEGHLCIIEILFAHGADPSLKNSSGDTAVMIAQNEGHTFPFSELTCNSETETCDARRNFNKASYAAISQKRGDSLSDTFYCEHCQDKFSNTEATSHNTSTVHLLNNKHKIKVSSYFIPNSNRGFQMLLRSGWNAHDGLGPDGQGRKYPIKTVLKQDRTGLGGDEKVKKKAKVTHFSTGDTEAVHFQKNPTRQISVRKAARKAAKLKEKRDRRWEQNLRYELH